MTYADMITLLLVLFIVLFALSKINQAKYRQFQQSVSHVKLVGTSVAHGSTSAPSRGPAPLSAAAAPARLRQIQQALTHALALKGLLGDVTIKIDASGLVEGLVADSTFFVTDSAQLSVLGEEIVDTSGHVLDSYPNNVDVAGYTDDQQITGGPFANNWALSAARSSTVVERLTTVDAVDPERVVAIGYGQYHPVSQYVPRGRGREPPGQYRRQPPVDTRFERGAMSTSQTEARLHDFRRTETLERVHSACHQRHAR